jgi:hypothetical protein
MLNEIDLTRTQPKRIHPLGEGFSGVRPDGGTLSFTNYFMELNGQPFFGVSGEIHYARLWEARWEDALLKMKAGGVNIASTYAFWIHHEEREGEFDFSGRRDLRAFVELCGKCGLHVIARIGPFCHGEVRNGGLPDWLYGKPFEVRSLDEGFLECIRRWYREVAAQLKGLYFKDGGPVIAVQLDNEYMHSAAPWEDTRGSTNEWLPAGDAGDEYLMKLLEIAREEGIDAPFYTATGWGGAATPEKMMPLWGGYAFRPWIFYSGGGEHPATEEYLYRDNHNDQVPKTYNFEPLYTPESRPYLCCEMGGGMFSSYNYRFQLPFESVDAMANVKLGSGCNMLGYYMFRGGTNPRGRGGAFLNEGQVPKLSYDFQAPLGEYGQARESYRRLRRLHLLTKAFEPELCRMKTFLSEGSQDIRPGDPASLRWAVRMGADGTGFLFLNNYQDHAAMAPKADETVTLKLPGGDLAFENLSLAAGENCILPFNLNVGGVALRLAHAQPITVIDGVAFFFAPEGMVAKYAFPEGTRIESEAGEVLVEGCTVRVAGEMPRFRAIQGGRAVRFVTLSAAESLRFGVVEYEGREAAVLADGAVLVSGKTLRIEHDRPEARLSVFPGDALPLCGAVPDGAEGLFTRFRLAQKPLELEAAVKRVGPSRYTVTVPAWEDSAVKDVLLELNYRGDVGQAFLNGTMIADNFWNGAPWVIGLAEFREVLAREPLTVVITPVRTGSRVNVESTMAGRREEVRDALGALDGVSLKPVYEWRLG